MAAPRNDDDACKVQRVKRRCLQKRLTEAHNDTTTFSSWNTVHLSQRGRRRRRRWRRQRRLKDWTRLWWRAAVQGFMNAICVCFTIWNINAWQYLLSPRHRYTLRLQWLYTIMHNDDNNNMYSGLVDTFEVFKPKICVPRIILRYCGQKWLRTLTYYYYYYYSRALSPLRSLPWLDDAALCRWPGSMLWRNKQLFTARGPRWIRPRVY